MDTRRIRIIAVALSVLMVGLVVIPSPEVKASHRVEFQLTDEPGRWFKNLAGPIAGTHSLAVATPGVEIQFSGDSHTVHTTTSLLFPTGAANMPFDRGLRGSQVVLTTPGLYVFVCKIHPYMLGAVIVDDPNTAGLDLGETLTLLNGITVPSSADLATRLLRTFFIATNPSNWQDYSSHAPWHVTYPDVDVRITGGAVVNLPAVLNARYGNDITLSSLRNPAVAGVGEVWVNTQFEITAHKEKPGTATAVRATDWKVRRKVALPQINMNNPHNMWTNRDQSLIFQTEWFDSKLTVFDRITGKFIRRHTVGQAPSHVMTRVDTDQVHVALNGSGDTRAVVELSRGAKNIERRIDIQRGHPHAHWMSHDGQKMVTPNIFTADSTIYDFPADAVAAVVPTGALPIATGMMPDSSKYYVANFLDNNINVINTHTGNVIKTINLIQFYDPVSGAITGPVGALPIQTPVDPSGRFMVTANTLTATIVITDTITDTMVAMLPGDPGCHGVQWGAKKGGGYYAYVTNKFSNRMIVVDPDPNGDGNAADAVIAGSVLLKASLSTAKDDSIIANEGQGGQGVLPIPVVYNGWVQKLPAGFKDQLTPAQRNPIQ